MKKKCLTEALCQLLLVARYRFSTLTRLRRFAFPSSPGHVQTCLMQYSFLRKYNFQLFMIIIMLLLLSWASYSQSYQIPDTRIEHMTVGDTTIQASVCLVKPDMKIRTDRFYYWFDSGLIHRNQGAWHGHLLHGLYRTFLPGGQLVISGSYCYGLKNGIWKEWQKNGSVKRIEYWDHGIQRNKSFYILNDSATLVKTYRRGVERRTDTIKSH